MSDNKIVLSVEKRENVGKRAAELRRDEIVPAVVYGKDFAPINIQAPYLEISRVARRAGTHTPVELEIDGQRQTAIIKSIDMDYVKNRISHISFQAVSADQVVTTEVPVVVVDEDESEAGRAGFMVMQSAEELEIKAKPADLPEKLEVSARNLKEHGDKLTVADIKLPSGVEFSDSDEEFKSLTIATVQDPAILAAQNEAADKAAEEAEKAKKAAEAPAEEAAAETEPAEGEKPSEEKSE
ncbi:MAG: 50S ribosomal protein L25 [Candidatus Nomurabacteria bacterium]|jgi:large subunit ribosomal protein L25|nr:50S ribosomal protein L25 [Candidatus Nomurabacteria bacterium]